MVDPVHDTPAARLTGVHVAVAQVGAVLLLGADHGVRDVVGLAAVEGHRALVLGVACQLLEGDEVLQVHADADGFEEMDVRLERKCGGRGRGRKG